MLNLLIESIIVGFVTLIIGSIIFNLSINRVNKEKNKPIGISLSFFITGVILHISLEFLGFNKWYSNKESVTQLCRLSELGVTCSRY
jgi:Kef-type K+ transport system membrane component KefB